MSWLERILWQSRWMIIPAVIASLVAALMLIAMGTYQVGLALQDFWYTMTSLEEVKDLDKKLIVQVVTAIDVYLIATVLLIFGIGLYELFINKISAAEAEDSSKILMVKSLDQLKEKLASVIVMVLIVTFFKQALALKYEDVTSLLMLGISIFLLSLSIKFISK